MSTTLRAWDTVDERDVVLKVAPKVKGEEAAKDHNLRLEREAAALRRLKHANVVELLDTFTLGDGRHVLVLEHVSGSTLQHRIDSDGLVPCSEFIPIASQILKALQHIHTKGSVLRDIKPSNVMLCAKQRYVDVVKIIDFGLTRLASGDDRITLDGGAGTPGFIPPEEIRGETVTSRGDIYSLGALFYYALSGVLPFEGKGAAELLYKQAHERPKSLEKVLPPDAGVPAGVIRMVDDCLSPNPDDRPDSAVVMMEQLIDALPARLFKLRKRETPSHQPPSSAVMSSDIVDLIPAAPSADAPASTRTEDSRMKRRGGAWLWIGLGVAALGVLAFLALPGGESSEPALPTPVSVPDEPAPSVTEAPTPVATETREPVAEQTGPSRAPVVSSSVLTIRSTPEGATIFVDGEDKGTTPLELDVSAGEHVVRAQHDGYADWSTRLTTAAGEGETFDVVLTEQAPVATAGGRSRWKPRRKRTGTQDAPRGSEPEADAVPMAPEGASSSAPAPTKPKSEEPKRFEKLGQERGLKKMGGRSLK